MDILHHGGFRLDYQAFGQTPQYWINLQATYDLKIAEKVVSRRIAGIRQFAHA